MKGSWAAAAGQEGGLYLGILAAVQTLELVQVCRHQQSRISSCRSGTRKQWLCKWCDICMVSFRGFSGSLTQNHGGAGCQHKMQHKRGNRSWPGTARGFFTGNTQCATHSSMHMLRTPAGRLTMTVMPDARQRPLLQDHHGRNSYLVQTSRHRELPPLT